MNLSPLTPHDQIRLRAWLRRVKWYDVHDHMGLTFTTVNAAASGARVFDFVKDRITRTLDAWEEEE